MGRIEEITVALPQDEADALRAIVAEGTHGSTSDLVREAIREWRERQQNYGYTIKELQDLIDHGRRSGLSTIPDVDALIAEGQRRRAAG